MKFCWTTITVNSLEESLAFYENIVGLKLERRFKTGPNGEIAFLGDGETKIELIYNSENAPNTFNDNISLGFQVDNLNEKIKLISECGIMIESGPFQPNPVVKFFFVKDPNGLTIQFVESKN